MTGRWEEKSLSSVRKTLTALRTIWNGFGIVIFRRAIGISNKPQVPVTEAGRFSRETTGIGWPSRNLSRDSAPGLLRLFRVQQRRIAQPFQIREVKTDFLDF